MIGVVMQLANEMVQVIVDGKSVYFKNEIGNQVATIEGLKLSKVGVIKEFPDLEHDEEWKPKAIEMFKERIRECKTEEEAIKYIIKDLEKHGYIAVNIQKQGFRPKKCRQ